MLLTARPSLIFIQALGKSRLFIGTGLVVSVAAIVVGFGLLSRYQQTDGPIPAPRVYAAAFAIPLDTARPTLIIVAHPKCPCTRATLAELSKLLGRYPGRFAAHAVFVQPVGTDESWATDQLWKDASALPGLDTRLDPDGRFAAALGVETSGTVLVFSPDGANLFTGGITGSRGHEGDNAGADAIAAIIEGRPTIHEYPAFGCQLNTPGRACPLCVERATR